MCYYKLRAQKEKGHNKIITNSQIPDIAEKAGSLQMTWGVQMNWNYLENEAGDRSGLNQHDVHHPLGFCLDSRDYFTFYYTYVPVFIYVCFLFFLCCFTLPRIS